MNHNNETNISNAMDLSEAQNRIFKAYLLNNSLTEAEIVMFKAYLLAYPLYTNQKQKSKTEIKNTNNYTMKFIIV
jgi:methyltransferase-like protein